MLLFLPAASVPAISASSSTAARLKELDGFKTRLYNNITHEFRTPLIVIEGMAGQIAGHEEEKVAYPGV